MFSPKKEALQVKLANNDEFPRHQGEAAEQNAAAAGCGCFCFFKAGKPSKKQLLLKDERHYGTLREMAQELEMSKGAFPADFRFGLT